MPICFLIVTKVQTGKDFYVLHTENFDIVAALFMFLQLLIRALVISMKYGTITEMVMRKHKKVPMSLVEVRGGLTQAGWVESSPDALFNEIGETLVRMDTEPKFFTFQTMNNIGTEAFQKFTHSDFTQKLDLKEKNYNYAMARAREITNDEVLSTMFDMVLDGETDKQKIYNQTLEAHPSMTKELFNDLWIHLEEEVTQKDNFQRYMFKPLESTLWLREAWL